MIWPNGLEVLAHENTYHSGEGERVEARGVEAWQRPRG